MCTVQTDADLGFAAKPARVHPWNVVFRGALWTMYESSFNLAFLAFLYIFFLFAHMITEVLEDLKVPDCTV